MMRSLFGKILVSHLIVLIITTASIGIFLSHLVADYLIEAKRAELIRDASATAAFIDTSTYNSNFLPDFLTNLGELSGTTLWVMDKDNHIKIGQPPRKWRHRINTHNHDHSSLFTGSMQSWLYTERNDDDPSIIVTVPLPSNPDRALFVYTSITGIAKTSAAIQELLFYAIGGSIILAGIFASFLARSLTRPIRQISQAAEKFALGDYATRTVAIGEDEIGKLGYTFNEMAAALSRIEKNRREFFSDITHELKTPIAAIQAVTESMIDGIVTDEKTKQRYLHTILVETKQMNNLISELLNLARLESGQLQIKYQIINIAEFMLNQQQKFQPLLAEKQQTLQLDLSPKLQTIRIDPLRLEQIITNLISNAIRHSPFEATISLVIANMNNTIILSIIDHGEGIPAADIPYLWERFYRVDKSRARRNGGTGLGLAITKKLVEGMNGTITVESIPHQTTIFRIEFPQT